MKIIVGCINSIGESRSLNDILQILSKYNLIHQIR